MTLWRNNKTQKFCYRGSCGLWGPMLSMSEFEGVQGAIVPAADGKGYTFEARVPWKVIHPGYVPKRGDELPFVWEVSLGNSSSVEPKRIFQIFANGGAVEGFRNASKWGGVMVLQ
jgi:hypothetical protein